MQSTSPTSPPPAPQKRKRPLWLKLIIGFVGLIVAGILCVLLVLGYALVVATPNLPSLDALTDYRPKVPLRIYTADHVLIGEFGEDDHQRAPREIARKRATVEGEIAEMRAAIEAEEGRR